MPDVHTREQRSYNMSQVKSKNTKPELIIYDLMAKTEYKFKKHYTVIGKPDLAFPDKKIAIFIDGEFWHGKGFSRWKHKLTSFWLLKIQENIRRDKNVRNELKKSGWIILRLWDKDILKDPQKAVSKIIKALN